MRLQSGMGLGENIYKLKNFQKPAFDSPIEIQVASAQISKLQEDRELEVVNENGSTAEEVDLLPNIFPDP